MIRTLLAALSAVPLLLAAPALALNPALSVKQYGHQAWANDEGLPQTTVHMLAQTKDGFLWIATDEGLVKFDGVRFTVFNHVNTPAFKSKRVRVVHLDGEGVLWAGTQLGGVTRYRDGVFEHVGEAEGLTSSRIHRFLSAKDGSIYVGTEEGLFRRPRGGRFELVREFNIVTALHEASDGSLWVGSKEGLHQLSGGQWRSFGSPEMPWVRVGSIFEDDDGSLLIGVRDGTLMRFDGRTFTPIWAELGVTYTVRTMLRDRHGSLWLGMDGGGLGRLRDGKLERLTADRGLNDDVVISLLEDQEGSLFIGTSAGGLNQLRDPKFTVVGKAEGLSHDVVWSVSEDRSGTVWLGTNRGMMTLSNDVLSLYPGTEEHTIWAMEEDRRGRVWLGGTSGLAYVAEDGALTWMEEEEGVRLRPTFSLLEARDGTLYVGSHATLSAIRGGKTSVVWEEKGKALNAVRDLAEQADGTLWLGLLEGLHSLKNGEVRSYSTADGLGSNQVKCLYVDPQDVLWICTDGGLTRFKDGKMKNASMMHGLFDDTVFRVLDDGLGFLWLTHNRGVSRISREEAEAFFDGRAPRLTHRWFGKTDGMRSIECNGTSPNSGTQTRDGRIWIPTTRGAAVIDPRRTVLNEVVPRVIIEEVVVNRRPVSLQGASELPPDTRDLSFRYTVPSFVDPAKVQFKYRLEGFDEGWVDAGSRREASYTNLAPGPYAFRVIAANNDGVWNEEGVAYEFEVLPHFYRTVWFRLLVLLAIIAVLWAAYAIRVRYLKRREAELRRHNEELNAALIAAREAARVKSEFVANISHELRTPLNSIVNLPEGMLELCGHTRAAVCRSCGTRFELEEQEELGVDTACPECAATGALTVTKVSSFDGDPDVLVKHLRTLGRAGHQLRTIVDDVLDFSKLDAGKMIAHPEEVSVREVFVELREALLPVAKARNVQLDIGEASEQVLRADPVKLTQLLNNLVDNAIKFSHEGGRVELRAKREVDACVLTVRDYGSGIAPEHHGLIFESFRQVDGSHTRKAGGTGLGLAITKQLVELHGGKIWLDSTVGQGTTFFVRLPLEGPAANPRLGEQPPIGVAQVQKASA